MTDVRSTIQKDSSFNQLCQQMDESFSLEEVRTLCLDLNINFDELPPGQFQSPQLAPVAEIELQMADGFHSGRHI